MRWALSLAWALLAAAGAGSAVVAAPAERVQVSSLPEWPVQFTRRANYTATAEVVDLEGTLAVAYSATSNNLHLLGNRALNLPGWPAEINASYPPCLADIDGDGEVEIFSAGALPGGAQHYFGFRLDGSPLPGWPVVVTTLPFISVSAMCTIADLDGDGTLEIIGGSRLGEVSVWDQDGELLDGWPVVLPVGVDLPNVPGSAVADLDGDGTLEVILTPASGFVHVLRHDGTGFPGFPVNLEAPIGRNPALADVDGDGQLEIIIATRGGRGTPRKRLFVLRTDGTFQPGFPVIVGDQVFSSVAIADLDRDGELWIVASVSSPSETIMVWNARTGQPRPGFPVFNAGIDQVFASPTVGDITGDGFPEILLTRSFVGFAPAMLLAWDRFGVPVEPFPLRVFQGFQVFIAASALTDLNDDGLIDILPAEGSLHALTTHMPYDPRTMEWPTESHDVRHTGVYSPPVDELRLHGRFVSDFVFLDRSPARLTARVKFVDRRRDLAATLARGGVRLAAINDRPVDGIEGHILAYPGVGGMGASVEQSDFIVQFDGRAVAAAILQRLRRAGVSGGEERSVRLKLESPLQDRRRVGGELRLQVRMPVGG